MKSFMNIENEMPKSNYYAILPAYVRYNKELKPSEKLMYGEITALSNKEGFCYASNRYFADLYGVSKSTISRWVSHLAECGFIKVEQTRNEKKEVIIRKIFVQDNPYMQNNQYPYMQNRTYPLDQNSKENNINNNIINTHTGEKKLFKENVYLYDYEYENLLREYGEKKTNRCIEELSLYKKSKGIEYKSDYATIKRWVIIRVEELEQRQLKKNKVTNKFCNYEQREYSAEFFESLYENYSVEEKEESSEENEDDMEM